MVMIDISLVENINLSNFKSLNLAEIIILTIPYLVKRILK
jgi:hypothetical protein